MADETARHRCIGSESATLVNELRVDTDKEQIQPPLYILTNSAV